MTGMTLIREKRGIQLDRDQIMVPTGSKIIYLFFTPVE
jgi:hypothetical protein